MTKITEVTPILIKDLNKDYRIANIIFSPNNSIYFTFPSTKKRIISEYDEKEYDNTLYSEHIRKLSKFKEESLEPKVSFHAPNEDHPNSMIVHINSNKIGSIINNRDVLNIGYDKYVFVYLMQIIIPNNLLFFDEYENKHSKFIEIDNSKLNGETLSLEFIIHSREIKISCSDLPYSKNRLIKNICTFNTTNDLTCSIVISTLKNSKSNNDFNYLLLSINTLEKHGLYKIINVEN